MYQLIVKLSDEEKIKLDKLCAVYGENLSECTRSLINENYDAVMGNPELAEVLEQMNALGRTIEKITGKNVPDLPSLAEIQSGKK